MTETDLEFRTLPGLWREYAEKGRSFAFQADNFQAAREWQQGLRSELRTLLGGFPAQACDLSPRVLEVYEEDGFTCQTITIQTQPGEYMPCRVLLPTSQVGSRLKPIIALHGHGTWGGAAIIKSPADPLGAALNQQLNYDYAGQLARRGYMVFVPELRGFGERLDPSRVAGAMGHQRSGRHTTDERKVTSWRLDGPDGAGGRGPGPPPGW